jgi:hypothetical protein
MAAGECFWSRRFDHYCAEPHRHDDIPVKVITTEYVNAGDNWAPPPTAWSPPDCSPARLLQLRWESYGVRSRQHRPPLRQHFLLLADDDWCCPPTYDMLPMWVRPGVVKSCRVGRPHRAADRCHMGVAEPSRWRRPRALARRVTVFQRVSGHCRAEIWIISRPGSVPTTL